MTKQKVYKTIYLIIGLIILAYFVGYIISINTKPYDIASDFISSNKILNESVGKIKSHHLSFFGYSLKYSGPNGVADFKILVNGAEVSGVIYISMRKVVGEWEVVDANFIYPDSSTLQLK